jgi:hypothetical protein
LSETNLLLDQIGVVGEAAGGSSVLVSSLGGSGTVSGSTRGGDRFGSGGSAVTIETGTVLAGKSEELVSLGALGNLDTILVGPFLDLTVRPRVQKGVAQGLFSVGGSGRDRGVGALRLEAGESRLAADSSNHRVTGVRLGNVVAALVEPSLEVGVRPGREEPITGVVGGLLSLLGDRLVVVTDSSEKRVTLTGLGDRNAVLVGESLELRIRPAV